MTGRPVLALVGGFLGAGKTSLLLAAARVLRDRGLRVGVVTNDQAEGLVDTRLAAVAGVPAEEIAGGCFCCRLSEFLRAAGRLLALAPDVVLAEPVGSCMDISATILQPIKQSHAARFRLAPFTVLVDPERARSLLGADDDVNYLFRHQLAEADLVYFSKADLGLQLPELPGGVAGALSARTGAGVREWLDLILGGGAAGTRILDVDYVRYAAAEAALGWLNYRVEVTCDPPRSPAQVVGPLLDDLDSRLTVAGAQVMHLKVLDEAVTGWVRASICRNGAETAAEGALSASPARRHDVLINLRALAAPELLATIIDEAVAALGCETCVVARQAFRPSPPVPERRLGIAVTSPLLTTE